MNIQTTQYANFLSLMYVFSTKIISMLYKTKH